MFTDRWVLLAVIPLFVLLAVMAYFSVQFAVDERAKQSWVVHTYQVIGRLQSILTDVEEAETGQRGYIITRQTRFLDTYRQGIAHAKGDLAEFRRMTSDNPRQMARGPRLASLLDARFKSLDTTLSKASSTLAATPELLAAMDIGNAKMDELREELRGGTSEENRLLIQRIAARHLAERNEIVATTLAAMVALFVLLATALLLVRNNIRLMSSEKKLENESAILQTTLDTIRDGIAMFASSGELCVFNDTFFKLFSLPINLARKGVFLAEIQKNVGSAAAMLLDAPNTTLPDKGFHRVSLDGLELDVYRGIVPTGGFIIVCVDVTERVQAELVARQAQKMEAIGHLTGGVAHDFNNILQIVSANLERVSREIQTDRQNVERLNSALSAAASGARLTSQLLAFGRRQALDPRSLNVGRVIQDMTNLLQRTLGEGVEVESIVAGGLWNTFVDRSQVENAILNLAINARDAMANSGKLTIEVANAFLDDAYALQHLEVTPGQYVMAAVSDTGNGMSAETISRAFEPFFTTKPEGRGTGLGLSQVYGFVKQSGGHIKIYSEIGQGTTVKLYLPRTRLPQESSGVLSVGTVRGGTERILVVEDDDAVRSAVVDMISELGYSVLKAENAEQALAILGSGVAIDLLFTDVIMPGPIHTRVLARRAQELHPNIRVLYTSGYTQNAIVHNGKLDDDVFLLSKPYSRDELARKLRSLLDPTVSASESNARKNNPAKEKVLVVEDVGLIRMTTVDMIEEIGFLAVEAANGEDAMNLLRSDPQISILMTDLGLPGMSGKQLVEEAVRLRPNLKIVIASGFSFERDAVGLPDKAEQLTKPFDIEQLRRALR
ncbi:MAG: CHASE3 domain-containing protein [Rhizomicrobium sp.]